YSRKMQFLIFYILNFITANQHRHASTTRPTSFTDQDPLLLLVNEEHPTRPLTLYDTHNEKQLRLPVGLAELSMETLPFQSFHSYYEGFGKNFYLEWRAPTGHNETPGQDHKKVKIIPEGDYLQAKRNFTSISSGMTAYFLQDESKNKQFIRIMAEGKCLEAKNEESKYRKAFPLVFRKCDLNSKAQNFKFISREKAICKLKECTSKAEIFRAEEIIRNRLNHFVM
ncbi:hypothetical protein M153_63410003, partial [Pseudoloma neurophilia]